VPWLIARPTLRTTLNLEGRYFFHRPYILWAQLFPSTPFRIPLTRILSSNSLNQPVATGSKQSESCASFATVLHLTYYNSTNCLAT
jgi:hypothetical protein